MRKIYYIVIVSLLIYCFLNYSYNKSQTHQHYQSNYQPNQHHQQQKKHEKNKKDICTGYLTDKEYLEHMIPHHQVAVDISVMLQEKTKSPVMQEILRKLIWTQRYEIKWMEEMKNKLNNREMSDDFSSMNNKYIPTIGDYQLPNKVGLTNTYCDPHFFDPDSHMKHMESMILDDDMYIEHMIPHHQVAVDMSKVLIKNTKNDFMIHLAYRIIRSQQEEIILLHGLLKNNKYKHKSDLLY